MKLQFIYAPTRDLASSAAFYRNTLGLEQSWREGDDTVAFALPGTNIDVMVSAVVTDDPPGPMYQVPNLAEYLAAHPGLTIRVPQQDIPDGHVIGIADPAGNVVYVFDQIPS